MKRRDFLMTGGAAAGTLAAKDVLVVVIPNVLPPKCASAAVEADA